MSYDKDKMYMIEDALCDILKGLNELTDMDSPNTQAIYNLAKSVNALQEAKLHGLELEEKEPAMAHESWGDADPTAREMFENLEKHYMGFWRCAAKYQATHSDEAKQSMLMHLEHQLYAHDDIADFVMKNCPALCDEAKDVIMKWKDSKKA